MEPTRNAWVALAAWFRRHGATVVMVPPEQSADLRDYYNNRAENSHQPTRHRERAMNASAPPAQPNGSWRCSA
jgi:transposase-like protein